MSNTERTSGSPMGSMPASAPAASRDTYGHFCCERECEENAGNDTAQRWGGADSPFVGGPLCGSGFRRRAASDVGRLRTGLRRCVEDVADVPGRHFRIRCRTYESSPRKSTPYFFWHCRHYAALAGKAMPLPLFCPPNAASTGAETYCF